MKRYGSFILLVLIFLGLAAFLSACGSGGGSSSGSGAAGNVNVLLTDAPGDFDHVYVTVTDVWFHTSQTAGTSDPNWQKFPLPTPVLLDLVTLANGATQSFWNNIELPAGTYGQIRIFLQPTYSAGSPSGPYNNYVVIGPTTYPLHIPDPGDGIQLLGAFTVTQGGTLRLAIDFDAGHDVVEFQEGTDYVLKPRLTYFDLDHSGAIIGSLSTGGTFTTAPHFVIKAERLATAAELLATGSTSTYHVIRRWTVPRADGSFILSPVSTLETATWDVVIRGLNYKTVIIKGVPVTTGSTPASGATNLGTITMSTSANSDYPVAGTIAAPTGAWVQFYQTLQAPGEYPYEIRFRHFNPLWGGFKQTFMLNDDQMQLASYVSNGVLSALTATTPAEGIGNYQAFADACLFNRTSSTPAIVSSSTVTVQFPTALTVLSPYQGNSVSGVISLATDTMQNTLDRGLLFAVNGGVIVNAIRVDSQMATGGTYTINDLPGGSSVTPLPGAFYGIDAFGWSSTNAEYLSIAIPQLVDLSEGNGTADLVMLPLW